MKKFNITVNGTADEVEVEEGRAAGAAAPAPRAAAPADGTVKAINVSAGQSVKVRDALVILG